MGDVTQEVTLPVDEKLGFAEGEYENDRYIRCPLGCGKTWDKQVDSFQMFFFHMEDHE